MRILNFFKKRLKENDSMSENKESYFEQKIIFEQHENIDVQEINDEDIENQVEIETSRLFTIDEIKEEIKKNRSEIFLFMFDCDNNGIDYESKSYYKKLIRKGLFLDSKIYKIEKDILELSEKKAADIFFKEKRTNQEILDWILDNKTDFKKYNFEDLIKIEDLNEIETSQLSILTEKIRNDDEEIIYNNLIQKWLDYSILLRKIENVDKTIIDIIGDYKQEKISIQNLELEDIGNRKLVKEFQKLLRSKKALDILQFISNISSEKIRQVTEIINSSDLFIPLWVSNFCQNKIDGNFINPNYNLEYNFRLKGIHIIENLNNLNNCQLFEEVRLMPEPSNHYDENAILVLHQNKKLGYVPADETLNLKEILNNNYLALLIDKNISGFKFGSIAIIY